MGDTTEKSIAHHQQLHQTWAGIIHRPVLWVPVKPLQKGNNHLDIGVRNWLRGSSGYERCIRTKDRRDVRVINWTGA
jgi:hypothetical protein